jgi:hypothetical protein
LFTLDDVFKQLTALPPQPQAVWKSLIQEVQVSTACVQTHHLGLQHVLHPTTSARETASACLTPLLTTEAADVATWGCAGDGGTLDRMGPGCTTL